MGIALIYLTHLQDLLVVIHLCFQGVFAEHNSPVVAPIILLTQTFSYNNSEGQFLM